MEPDPTYYKGTSNSNVCSSTIDADDMIAFRLLIIKSIYIQYIPG